jgi:hypothetical protein
MERINSSYRLSIDLFHCYWEYREGIQVQIPRRRSEIPTSNLSIVTSRLRIYPKSNLPIFLHSFVEYGDALRHNVLIQSICTANRLWQRDIILMQKSSLNCQTLVNQMTVDQD